MQGLKPALKREPSARLKSCPDTKLTSFEFFSSMCRRAQATIKISRGPATKVALPKQQLRTTSSKLFLIDCFPLELAPDGEINGRVPEGRISLRADLRSSVRQISRSCPRFAERSIHLTSLVSVRGTELLASDSRETYREKLARITLDSMVQFVGLLDAQGTVLEINHVALNAVGIELSDVEGVPFWTTFWWQVSDQINAELRDSIRRASAGGVRSLGCGNLRPRRRQRDDHHRRLAHAGEGRRGQSCFHYR